MTHEIIFIHPAQPETDRELFFGPLDGTETFVEIGDGWIMADIMVAAGKFPSKGQARKNGWDKGIPAGYNKLTVGKNRNRTDILILNRFED